MSAQGKRIMVIGGETTVGRVITTGLAEAGADVAIASITTDKKAEFAINSALNELWAIGRKGLALAIDASDSDKVRAAVERAESELGSLDMVVVVGGSVSTDAVGPTRIITVEIDSDAGSALSEALAALA